MRPVVLLIRDGWGIRKEKRGNAPALAKTPNMNKFLKRFPTAVLKAAEESVGLPKGYQGNSEVGHLTIGSGRVVEESLLRINKAIKNGSLAKNKVLSKLIKGSKTLHLMGLVQDQGVHAHSDHLKYLIRLAKKKGVKDLLVHVFTDGRDTPPRSAAGFIADIDKEMKRQKLGRFGVMIGRYYAMDRDNRWMRTEMAYDAIAKGKGSKASDWKEALARAYAEGQDDEFIKPRIIDGYSGVNKGDGILFFNYRYDRARQLTKAFVEDDFEHFYREKPEVDLVCMTEYYKDMPCPALFEQHDVTNLLGEVLSKKSIHQLRISETEKYAHVTFFFNGLVEEPFENEDRILIHSPKVATYDMKPEMSVYEIKDRLLQEMPKYDLVVVNLVNGDMVGHTGDLGAAKKAVEAVDECCGEIVKIALSIDGTVLMTADHGNCEEMVGDHQTSHTLNPVHLILASKKLKLKRKTGTLADIAPTILKLFDIKKPKEMTGKSLI